MLSCFIPAQATHAPCLYSSGHLTYCTSSDLIGNYYSTLSSAAYLWNDSRSSYYCYNNVSLTEVAYGTGAVTVDFITGNPDSTLLGIVYLWFTTPPPLMETYPISLAAFGNWDIAELHIYPYAIANAISSTAGFSSSDLPACMIKSTVHEFGHLLGLAHPESYVSDPSRMRPGLSTSVSPTYYDRYEVHTNWCT